MFFENLVIFAEKPVAALGICLEVFRPLRSRLQLALVQGIPTCGTRTSSGMRRSSRWYASNFHFTQKLGFTAFEFTYRALFLNKSFFCSLQFLFYSHVITFVRC